MPNRFVDLKKTQSPSRDVCLLSNIYDPVDRIQNSS